MTSLPPPGPDLGPNRGVAMAGFVEDIERLVGKNSEFRRVLYTAKNCQLVIMALKPQEEIGTEVERRKIKAVSPGLD